MQDSFSIACAGTGVVNFARRVWPAVMLAVLTACGGSGGTTTPLPDQLSIAAPPRASVASATRFGSSLPADATGLTYLWDFGDGTTSAEASPAHTYAQPGDYKVSLTITDAAGANRVSTMTVTAGYFDQVKNLVCSGPDQTGWCWQQPRPSGNAIRDVTFVDANVGWAVGEQGQILNTSNGGLTWTAQASGTRSTLSKVVFLDASNGWAAGDTATLLHTTNGGRTWEAQVAGFTANYSGDGDGLKLTVLDAQSIVLTYGTNATQVSRDGGKTWKTSSFSPTQITPGGKFWQISNNYGYSDAKIVTSIDDGKTSNTFTLPV